MDSQGTQAAGFAKKERLKTPQAHPQLAFFNAGGYKRIAYYAPQRDMNDGFGGLEFASSAPTHAILASVPADVLNALLMIDYRGFFSEAATLFSKAACSNIEVLESVSLELRGVTIPQDFENLLADAFEKALCSRARAYQSKEFAEKLQACLEAYSFGVISAQTKYFICEVLCDADLEYRTLEVKRLYMSLSKKRTGLADAIEAERVMNATNKSHLVLWASDCNALIQAFSEICSSKEVNTYGLRAETFGCAYSSSMWNKPGNMPRAVGQLEVWKSELSRSWYSTSYLQALWGLALEECSAMDKQAHTKLADSAIAEAWNNIALIPLLEFEDVCQGRECITQGLEAAVKDAHDAAKTRLVDCSVLMSYMDEIAELTNIPRLPDNPGSWRAEHEFLRQKPKRDFASYLHQKALKHKWAQSYFAMSPSSFPEVVHGILYGALLFNYKYKFCNRCQELFFYTGPHQLYCNRMYQKTNLPCSAGTMWQVAGGKNGKTLNPKKQAIIKRSKNQNISKALKAAYLDWAEQMHMLGNFYMGERRVSSEQFAAWLDGVLPNKEEVDFSFGAADTLAEGKTRLTKREQSLRPEVFPRAIIWNGEIIDGNMLVEVPQKTVSKLSLSFGQSADKSILVERDPKTKAWKAQALDIQLAVFSFNAQNSGNELPVPGL